MPSFELPSHAEAARQGVGRAPRDPNAPPGWPGTYVPNLSDWRLGDILLAKGTGLVGVGIQLGQSITARPHMALGAAWTHAAIYVGGGMVVDATGKLGVDEQSLWNYVERRPITLRRITDPAVTRAEIDDIAACARTHIGEPYSTLQVILAKLGWGTAQTPNRNALYCSTFVGLVVTEATQVELASKKRYQPLYPGVLATHPGLTSVPLEWRNI